MKGIDKTAKKLTVSIIAIIFLTACLAVTSYALALTIAAVKNNTFVTGGVHINLNDGKPLLQADEFLFEPGMTVEKDFFIENESTHSVYYKLYFDKVSGDLADVVEITVKNGGDILYRGTISELSKTGTEAAGDILQRNERRNLVMYFRFPENSANSEQGSTLSFTFCADAVQTKNNADKEF